MSEKILVVDDQPVNVQLLKRKLEREGLVVESANSGAEAFEIIEKTRIDLILLDVMMPEMDGIEVCKKLQADEKTRAIPVIFVTARGAREHKIEGLSIGAVDYITKPVDLDEMTARVRTQLRLASINREMIDLQSRLFESRRAAMIGAVMQGIAHNLNNMLAVVLGYVDLIKLQYNRPEQVKGNATKAESAVQRIAGVIKQLNMLVVQARPPMSHVALGRLLENSVSRYRIANAIPQTTPVTIDNPLEALEVELHVESFEDLLGKILINAWESYGPANAASDTTSIAASGSRPIEIHTAKTKAMGDADAFEIRISDRGRGISEEIRDHIFEPFVSTKQYVGVGMGLSIARHTLRSLGGDISFLDREGGGTTAVIVCPIRQTPKE